MESNKGKGIYVNKVPIESAQIKYNAKEDWMSVPDDVRIYTTYDSGRGFDKNLDIGGRFNKEKKHWGSALKVKMLFDACGVNTKDTDIEGLEWKIPESWMDQIVGKEILVLSYVTNIVKKNGKNLWLDWNDVMHPDKGYDALKDHFMKQHEKGYVKRYSPDSGKPSGNNESDETVVMNKEEVINMIEKDKINIDI